jgi:flavodoxin
MKAVKLIIGALALALALALAATGPRAHAQDAYGGSKPPPKKEPYQGGEDAFGKNLIMVFSLTGNTLKLARAIEKRTGGDVYEIRTVGEYPAGDDLIPFTKAQRDNKEPVEFRGEPPGLGPYDTVFFGTPVWFHDIPYPISVFLAGFDFQGKRVIPFVTSGGGPGEIVRTLSGSIRGGRVDEALLISRYANKSQEEIDTLLDTWLNRLAARKGPAPAE